MDQQPMNEISKKSEDIQSRISRIKESLNKKNFFSFMNNHNDNVDGNIEQQQQEQEYQELLQIEQQPSLNLSKNSSSNYYKSTIEQQQQNKTFAEVNILTDKKLIDLTQLYEVLTIGMVFEVIIVKKDMQDRNLIVQLSRFHSICDQCNLQTMKVADIQNLRDRKQLLDEFDYIYLYQIQAIIPESQLMEYFSIFSNDFNFNTVQEGDELYAVITKNDLLGLSEQEQRNLLKSKKYLLELSTKNEILQNSKFISIENLMDPQTYDPNSDLFVRLGLKVSNNVKVTQEDIHFFQKYGIYPYDLQIRRCPTLKNITKHDKEIGIERAWFTEQTFHEQRTHLRNPDRLQKAIKFLIQKCWFMRMRRISKHFYEKYINRIRELQNIKWAKQSLEEATALIQENKHQQALQYLSTAQDFDPYMPQIYLTRGCALANLGKYKEGVIELKKSLSLDSTNEVAQKYLERILKKYEEEQKLLYTKQAKSLQFDKQKLEMKNNAASTFNQQDNNNNYKYVIESDSNKYQQKNNPNNANVPVPASAASYEPQQTNPSLINRISNQQLSLLAGLNSKRNYEQLANPNNNSKEHSKKENKSRATSSSSSSSDRKKKKKKDKKSKKDKEKKEKKKTNKS